jgi:hypothetical protein
MCEMAPFWRLFGKCGKESGIENFEKEMQRRKPKNETIDEQSP